MTKTLLFLSVFASGLAFAQEDLLKDIDTVKTNTETSQLPLKPCRLLQDNLQNWLPKKNGTSS